MPTARQINRGEHGMIGDIIGDSFSDDPVNLWIFGGEACMRAYYTKAAKKLYLPRGYGHVEERENGGSLWLPPMVEKKIPIWNSLDIATTMVKHSGVRSIGRGTTVDTALAKAKPTIPHYYLFAIGARTAHQGKGIGGALMKAGLERVDSEKMPAYLESSKESNIGFYQQFGFNVTEIVSPPNGCPPLWAMWREARS